MSRNSIYFNYPYDAGCPYHRLLLPARFCGEDIGKLTGWTFHVGDGFPPGHNIYALTGLPNESAVIMVARLKAKGAKFVWSLDDDWLSIPDWNPAKPNDNQLAMWYLLREIADWIIVSTPRIAETLKDVSDKVLIAPNLLDLSAFPPCDYSVMENGERAYNIKFQMPVRVVWSGGVTHSGDVAVIEDVIERILSTYTFQQVAVIFQGMAPPSKLVTKYLYKGLFHQPSVPFTSYQQVLNSINANVYLAPLAPIGFNLSKSNLRIMEAWALMAPPIASEWGEYSCIRSGHDGRLVINSDGWWDALNRLIKDHEYRFTLAANGRKRVEDEYDWNNKKCRKPWYQLFSKILDEDLSSIYES